MEENGFQSREVGSEYARLYLGCNTAAKVTPHDITRQAPLPIMRNMGRRHSTFREDAILLILLSVWFSLILLTRVSIISSTLDVEHPNLRRAVTVSVESLNKQGLRLIQSSYYRTGQYQAQRENKNLWC